MEVEVSYTLQIKKYSDDKVIKEFGPYRHKEVAEAVDNGVSINLNHEDYYTVIYEAENGSEES